MDCPRQQGDFRCKVFVEVPGESNPEMVAGIVRFEKPECKMLAHF